MFHVAVIKDPEHSGSADFEGVNKDVFQFSYYADIRSAFQSTVHPPFEILLLDAPVEDYHQLEAAKRLLQQMPELPIVMLANSARYALDALQSGVLDYIIRPMTQKKLCDLGAKIRKRMDAGEVIHEEQTIGSYRRTSVRLYGK